MPQELINDNSTLVQLMLGAIRPQANTQVKIYQDQEHHMASLGHNELNVNV